MSIRTLLEGAVRYTSPAINIIKVTGTDKETQIQGTDKTNKFLLDAHLPTVIPEFAGSFGIGNIDLLKGLLNHALYKADKATIAAKRRANANAVEMIEFRDANKIGCDFRCMSPDQVPPQATITRFAWDITFKPDPARVAEFVQLSGLFAGGEVKDPLFSLMVDQNRLVASFGRAAALGHRGSMILATDISSTLKAPMLFSQGDFISLLKLGAGHEITVKVAQTPPVLGVEIATPIGPFQYYLRKYKE